MNTKMIMQHQSIKKNGSTYAGTIIYLTDMLYLSASYEEAWQEIADAIQTLQRHTNLHVKKHTLTTDGTTGAWGFELEYNNAVSRPPLIIGADIDSPDDIYERYYDYVQQQLDDEGYTGCEIDDISETAEGLKVKVVSGDMTETIYIDYPDWI